MNDHCRVCQSPTCILRAASRVPPSRGFQAHFGVMGGMWAEVRAQSPRQHVLNCIAGVVLGVSAYVFALLVL